MMKAVSRMWVGRAGATVLIVGMVSFLAFAGFFQRGLHHGISFTQLSRGFLRRTRWFLPKRFPRGVLYSRQWLHLIAPGYGPWIVLARRRSSPRCCPRRRNHPSNGCKAPEARPGWVDLIDTAIARLTRIARSELPLPHHRAVELLEPPARLDHVRRHVDVEPSKVALGQV
jgi:hypothetical protein